MRARRDLLVTTLILLAALVVSGIGPRDRLTWWLEVAPVLIVLPILWWTVGRFPLTRLLYGLIALHGVILCYGGHYTYAETPLGFWLQDLLGAARNHYDRVGHIAQGFVPAIATREILLRTSPLERGGWLFFLVTCVCMAASVTYEFAEWGAAMVSAEAAESFLGTQGDAWDTQWDMFLATLGAIAAQLLLARFHDRQLAAMMAETSSGTG